MYEPVPVVRALVLLMACIVVFAAAFNLLDTSPAGVGVESPPVVATVGPAAAAALNVPFVDASAIAGGAGGCLSTVQRGSASMDICWQAYRLMNEEDVSADYYALEVTATAHGTQEGGIRWAVVQAETDHALSSIVSDHQEVELAPGHCRNILATGGSGLMRVPSRVVTACERWRSGPPSGGFLTARTTWDCGGCTSPIIGHRDVSLVHLVSTLQGEVPSWRLAADLGV
jgi:hypothetical protein